MIPLNKPGVKYNGLVSDFIYINAQTNTILTKCQYYYNIQSQPKYCRPLKIEHHEK